MRTICSRPRITTRVPTSEEGKRASLKPDLSRSNQLSAPTAQKIARIIESAAATGRMPRLQRATRKAKKA